MVTRREFALLSAAAWSRQAVRAQHAQTRAETNTLSAQLLYSSTLAGDWLINNQEKRLTGRQPFNGDYGRWLYEYKPADGSWRGSVCWTTGTGIMGLALLSERTGLPRYREALLRAAVFLESLQLVDSRNPSTFGAIRELNQLSDYIFPRDGVTGGIGGYLALYRFTRKKEYLERAELFGDWFLRCAMNPATHWPYHTVRFDGGHLGPADPRASYKAAWQAGAGLFFYQLYKVTGKRVYLEKGVLPFAEELAGHAGKPGMLARLRSGNDDFATITLLCAYRATGEKRYWDAAVQRVNWLVDNQREDGAIVPGNTGGIYISALTALDAMEVASEKKLALDTARVQKFVRRCAEFGLTVQETEPHDLKAYGGFYGQLNLANFKREWIHARATTYSVIFNLRYEGVVKVPFYSAFGWN